MGLRNNICGSAQEGRVNGREEELKPRPVFHLCPRPVILMKTGNAREGVGRSEGWLYMNNRHVYYLGFPCGELLQDLLLYPCVH